MSIAPMEMQTPIQESAPAVRAVSVPGSTPGTIDRGIVVRIPGDDIERDPRIGRSAATRSRQLLP